MKQILNRSVIAEMSQNESSSLSASENADLHLRFLAGVSALRDAESDLPARCYYIAQAAISAARKVLDDALLDVEFKPSDLSDVLRNIALDAIAAALELFPSDVDDLVRAKVSWGITGLMFQIAPVPLDRMIVCAVRDELVSATAKHTDALRAAARVEEALARARSADAVCATIH